MDWFFAVVALVCVVVYFRHRKRRWEKNALRGLVEQVIHIGFTSNQRHHGDQVFCKLWAGGYGYSISYMYALSTRKDGELDEHKLESAIRYLLIGLLTTFCSYDTLTEVFAKLPTNRLRSLENALRGFKGCSDAWSDFPPDFWIVWGKVVSKMFSRQHDRHADERDCEPLRPSTSQNSVLGYRDSGYRDSGHTASGYGAHAPIPPASSRRESVSAHSIVSHTYSDWGETPISRAIHVSAPTPRQSLDHHAPSSYGSGATTPPPLRSAQECCPTCGRPW